MLNQVQLIGFTGAEPEIRNAGENKVAILRVATSTYKTKGGEKREFTTWHTIEIWSPRTIKWLSSRPLPKGSKVFVQGEIRHDRYTDEKGVEKFFSKVSVAGPGQMVKTLDRPEQNPSEED
jgi:single-strand DNA-binding protein